MNVSPPALALRLLWLSKFPLASSWQANTQRGPFGECLYPGCLAVLRVQAFLALVVPPVIKPTTLKVVLFRSACQVLQQ